MAFLELLNKQLREIKNSYFDNVSTSCQNEEASRVTAMENEIEIQSMALTLK